MRKMESASLSIPYAMESRVAAKGCRRLLVCCVCGSSHQLTLIMNTSQPIDTSTPRGKYFDGAAGYSSVARYMLIAQPLSSPSADDQQNDHVSYSLGKEPLILNLVAAFHSPRYHSDA